MNVGYLLFNSALRYPDRIAIISEDRRISYKLLNLRANKVAQAMKGCGLEKGDRVAIMCFTNLVIN